MKPLWDRIMAEPAIAVGLPTVIFASAAGVWQAQWLDFMAAAFAAVGALLLRSMVTPTRKGDV